jgi:hypothetical protein
MSRYYANYPQYLGAQKCCNLKTPGPQGPTGPTGDGGIGERGWTGATGPTGMGKSFIINHPVKPHNFLVHACLEGPEAGVYYRGVGEILDNESTTIKLPYYVDKLATTFTIQITAIYNGKINILNTSEVTNNTFIVYGNNCKFYWNVYGKRLDINIEPLKTDVNVRGNGPYLYLS